MGRVVPTEIARESPALIRSPGHLWLWRLTSLGDERRGDGGREGLLDAADATDNPAMRSASRSSRYGLAYRDTDPVAAYDALRRGLAIAQDSGNRWIGDDAHAALAATAGPRFEANQR